MFLLTLIVLYNYVTLSLTISLSPSYVNVSLSGLIENSE
jgi:hypothetical protein